MIIAINGFGRIGRAFLKLALERPGVEIAAVNDLGDIDNLAYLLKYDTVYGKSELKIEVRKPARPDEIGHSGGDAEAPYLSVNGHKILFLSEKEPKDLPWGKLGIDVVVESTGLFESYAGARGHIEAGAKRVVITAPAKGGDEGGATVLMGINENKLSSVEISSNASCTTNAGSPVMAILDEGLGIEKAILNTVHAYTATQKLVDSPDKMDFRRGRAGGQNIVPSTTGAAIAVTKALSSLAGKFDGIAIRVPVVSGSIADITFVSRRPTTVEEVNRILSAAALSPRWRDIFAVTTEPLVSSDIVGDMHASIADLAFTKVVGGNLVKVLAWYDNEMGYARTLVEHVIRAGEHV